MSDTQPHADTHAHQAEAEHAKDHGTAAGHDHAHDAAHDAAAGHGHGDHGFTLGRHVNHPPEPPQVLQMWYLAEQKKLVEDWKAANPGKEAPSQVENWLESDGHGGFVAKAGKTPTLAQTLHYGRLEKPVPIFNYAPWENHAFLALAMVFLVLFMLWLTAPFRSDRKGAMRKPTRRQVVIESLAGGIDEFIKGMIGEENGRKYMPYIASMFCLILVCNLMGMVPGMKPPTSALIITFSFALCTFLHVQYTAWFRLGIHNYVYHLMGQPKDAIGWLMAPLFLILEVISDFFAKPLSLSLRLFGNIMGKDVLFGAFTLIGISIVAAINKDLGAMFGVPLTIPFYFLGLLLSAVQALVFSLLSVIYIMLVLPHDHDHHGDEHHGEGDDHGHGHHGHHAPAVVHEAMPR